MKSIKKRLLSLLTVLALCACFTTTAFAAETPKMMRENVTLLK